ncbi:HAMP domain-containing sensor histidine kinase [Aquisalimonas lutea]|uniref:sensor histidine kinase n=1 Tax=Aquisalimonas lutea TaxID=1327750 RepID=UPI0025B2AC5F|nr:HAMP domain-containing sensor histidine kinase [Aquisalimonas lutea]MDN3516186.1 HAMP domain-containing sensor histidine kinase [Aquisalimonas lutea]
MAHAPESPVALRQLRSAWSGGYSLRWALILRVLVPLLLAMGLITVVGLRTLESALETRMKEDVELIARAVRLPISDSLERGEYASVRQALESVFRIGRVYGASVYDDNGDLVAAVGAFNPSPRSRALAERASQGERGGSYERIQGREVYSYFEPLTDAGGDSSGLLQVTRRGSDFRNDIARLRLQATVFMGVAGGVITLLLLVGHRGAIGKYLSALAGSMARIEAGDRQHRAATEGPKEVRSLSSAFNTMLNSMQAAEAEIARRRSDQARLEDELRHAEKLAAIGRLAAGVAHELGTPLSVIDGKAQRALRHADQDSRQEQALERIRGEVARMEHIVRQLLEFGRSANRQFRWTRVGDLVRAAVASLEDVIREHGVTVVPADRAPEAELHVDPVRIEQVLVNLVRNAIQAGAQCVRLRWDADEERVCLCVDDDGPGVADDNRERLFEPFYTTRSVGEGTGLGLAVVHGIVTEHGGTIAVDDSPEGGARFRVILPRQADGADATRQRSDHGGQDDDQGGGGPAGRG